MSLESQITTLEDSVQESYNVLEEKGSKIPAKATLANLASTILGIPEPEKPQYGILSYYSVWSDTITLQDAMECVVNSFNETKLKAFADANGGFREYMMFNYEEDWEQGGHRWLYQTPSSSVYIAENDFLSTTGIDVTVTSEYGFASINFNRQMSVDKSSQVVSADLTANDWAVFNGGVRGSKFTVNDGATSVPRAAVKSFVFGELPTTIGDYVLERCDNLVDVDMSYAKFTTTGMFFMSYLWSFNNPVVLPNTLQKLGNYFLNGESNADPETGYLIYTPFNSTVTLPEGLTEIGSGFLGSCHKFNQAVNIPSTVKKIGSSFLFQNDTNSPSSFNQTVSLPEGLEEIGSGFLSQCTNFNQDITFPSTLTSIGTSYPGFMRSMDKMTGALNIGNLSPTILSGSENTILSATSASSPAYTTGITIKGANRAAWLTALPNRTSSPYRKLIDGGE